MSKLLASNAAAHEDSITSLIWTTADVILTGSIDETVKCWRPDALDRPIDTIKDQELSVVAISCDKSGSRVATSSMDGHLRLYSTTAAAASSKSASVSQTADINAGPLQSWAVAMNPAGTRVATISHRGTLSVYSTGHTSDSGDNANSAAIPSGAGAGAVVLSASTGESCLAFSLSYSPNGELIAAGFADGTVAVLSAATGVARWSRSLHAKPVRAVAWAPDSASVVTGSDDGTVRVTAAADGAALGGLEGHQSWVLAAAVSADGARVATACADRKVRVFDLASRALRAAVEAHTGKVWAVAFSPDGAKVASGADDGSLCISSCE